MKQAVQASERESHSKIPAVRSCLSLMSLSFLSLSSSDYVFVTPVEVDSEGGYLTHDVTRRSHRSRRSLSPSVHYRLSAFGQDLHLDLHPSPVVGPGFTVQTLGSDGIATPMPDVESHNCLYQGVVRNLSSSTAAISTCAGLVSVCQVSSRIWKNLKLVV